MGSYLKPLDINNTQIFNINDYDHSMSGGLNLSVTDKRYVRLHGTNNIRGITNFFNLVNIYDASLKFYDGLTNTAYIDNMGSANFTNILINNQNLSNIFAPLLSPHFEGIPISTQPEDYNNTNQIATCIYVRNNINALVGGAPYFLDTLNEIATAINNDPDFAATVFTLINLKQNIINNQNKLNVAYLGNGDITNTTLSYLKDVTYDINDAFEYLNDITTGISFANNTTTILNALKIDKSKLYLTDISGSNVYYSSLYYDNKVLYITNNTDIGSSIVFRFF